MEKRRRKFVLLALVGLMLAGTVAAPGHMAKIEILTHDQADLNPHRLQAAIDLGLFGFSFLYTWTSKLAR